MAGLAGKVIIGIGLEVSAPPARSWCRPVPRLQLACGTSRASVRGRLAGDGLDHPLLGGLMGLGLDVLAHVIAGHGDGGIDQIADDLFHVAADIADLGELGGLDLDERRAWPASPAGG
jgi:hypothetical protein